MVFVAVIFELETVRIKTNLIRRAKEKDDARSSYICKVLTKNLKIFRAGAGLNEK